LKEGYMKGKKGMTLAFAGKSVYEKEHVNMKTIKKILGRCGGHYD
jgi:hypothetical protein